MSGTNDRDFSSNDSILLYDIACLDPIEFGSGVYQARSIIDWDGFCLISHNKLTVQNEKELETDSSFKIYPNPTFNELSIESIENVSQIRILDFNGNQVFIKNCNSVKEQLQIKLLPGIYLIQIEKNDGTIIINKICVL